MNKQNNYRKQNSVLGKYEVKLKPPRKVMRRYREVLGMTDMPTALLESLTRESNRIED